MGGWATLGEKRAKPKELMDMKSYRKALRFDGATRRAFINITPQVMQCIEESEIIDCLALMKTKHMCF